MAESTGIVWASSTFNCWMGCTKISPGCTNCYAAVNMAVKMHGIKWGLHEERKVTSDSYWQQPLTWNRKAQKSGEPWRVFCGSLCDYLDHEGPKDVRARLFKLAAETPYLTWMFLTKRTENFDMLPAEIPPNWWIGATTENQDYLERRVADLGKLKKATGCVTFMSYEPGLSPLSLFRAFELGRIDKDNRPDWLIVGCESGPRRRPFNIEWATSAVNQCQIFGITPFVKQLDIDSEVTDDITKFPVELQVREFPKAKVAA